MRLTYSRFVLMATMFILAVSTSHPAYSQTRKETEEFLVKNIAGTVTEYKSKYGIATTRWDIKFNKDIVTIKENKNAYTFDIKNIDPDNIELSQLEDGSYQIDLKTHDGKMLVKRTYANKNTDPLDTYHAQLFNITAEKRTANQLLKAFKHLATLAQPKEAFE